MEERRTVVRQLTGNDQREKNLIIAYIIITAALLVLIKTVQSMHAGRVINRCMFMTIAVNTAMTAYFYLRYGRKIEDRHSNLIACGLFATFIADLFATLFAHGFKSTSYMIGISCFCIVQIIYAAYLRAGRVTVVLRVVMIAAGLMILRAAGMLKAGMALGLINEILVVVNAIEAWTLRRFSAPVLFRIGIALFCACDLSIAVRSVTSGSIHQAAAFVVWIFYVPAQLLITLAYAGCCRTRRLI